MKKCSSCGYPNLDSAVLCVKCMSGIAGDRQAQQGASHSPLNPSPQSQSITAHVTPSLRQGVKPDLTAFPSAIAEKAYASLIDPAVFSLETAPATLNQIFALVLQSPSIQTNPLYSHRANSTSLLFSDSDTTVNAFATDQPVRGSSGEPPYIVVLGGLCNVSKIAAWGLATSLETGNRDLLLECMRTTGKTLMTDYSFSLERGAQISEALGLKRLQTNEIQRKARSFFASMLLNVISHEMGHIALGHTLGAGTTLEVSRNQEHQADLFASDVISTTPFSDYNCYGGALWWIVLTWLEEAVPSSRREVTTHPFSRDRLMVLINANKSQFEAIGITVDSIRKYLP